MNLILQWIGCLVMANFKEECNICPRLSTLSFMVHINDGQVVEILFLLLSGGIMLGIEERG